MIEISKLTKRYGDKLAVDDISFTVNEGEILGFLGPNGAGKSTTMNIITGYLSASSGTVRVAGHDILTEPNEVKKRIGYLPEQPPLYLDMTVDAYLDFLFDLKKVKGHARLPHIAEVCGVVGISDVRSRVIKNLSKGYRQRVGLAGALIGSPEVLILDEPTVGLDPKQIIEIRNLIRDLGKKHTVILSSHILPEVEAVCERVIVINKGRLIADDTPEHLSVALARDASVFVRFSGDAKRAAALLRALPGVSSVADMGKKESGARELIVKPKKKADLRADIAKAMVDGGFSLLGLRFAEMTLEDIFLELISEEEH